MIRVATAAHDASKSSRRVCRLSNGRDLTPHEVPAVLTNRPFSLCDTHRWGDRPAVRTSPASGIRWPFYADDEPLCDRNSPSWRVDVGRLASDAMVEGPHMIGRILSLIITIAIVVFVIQLLF